MLTGLHVPHWSAACQQTLSRISSRAAGLPGSAWPRCRLLRALLSCRRLCSSLWRAGGVWAASSAPRAVSLALGPVPALLRALLPGERYPRGCIGLHVLSGRYPHVSAWCGRPGPLGWAALQLRAALASLARLDGGQLHPAAPGGLDCPKLWACACAGWSRLSS